MTKQAWVRLEMDDGKVLNFSLPKLIYDAQQNRTLLFYHPGADFMEVQLLDTSAFGSQHIDQAADNLRKKGVKVLIYTGRISSVLGMITMHRGESIV